MSRPPCGRNAVAIIRPIISPLLQSRLQTPARRRLCRSQSAAPKASRPRQNTSIAYRSLAFVQFEPAKIVLHDTGHGHLDPSSKVVLRHLPLQFRRLKNSDDLVGKIDRIAFLVEANRHAFPVGHAAQIFNVRTHNRDSEFARLVGRPA